VRRRILEAAGIPVVVDPADLDERSIEAEHTKDGTGPERVALWLAREKALAVARRRPGIVLGADQTLALGARRFSKPVSPAAVREQLSSLAGNTHALHSAVVVADSQQIVFETVESARLTMRPLSKDFLDSYLADAGERVTASVGAYQLEGLGVHLFERIEGDHSTILGLPLLPLLAFFRQAGLVQS
jgi:septum formation protein